MKEKNQNDGELLVFMCFSLICDLLKKMIVKLKRKNNN